jgi:hypothetical protein
MSPLRRTFRLSVALTALVVAQSAWALDVKPGLWEIEAGDTGTPMRVCYTTEFLNSYFSDRLQRAGQSCRIEVKESSPTRFVTHTACTGSTNIETDQIFEVKSPESMTMESTSILSANGQQEPVRTHAQYRWLQTDCGDVQPTDPNKIVR